MRKAGLTSILVLVLSTLAAPAAAATCPGSTFSVPPQTYSTSIDVPLTVPNPGVFTGGTTPSCKWHYTSPADVSTLPSGTLSNVMNDPLDLGTTSQGGFTFTPADGYFGQTYFHVVSDAGEFEDQVVFINVGTSEPGGGSTATSKADCKNGGWKTATRANGTTFKNEGACVSYVSNGK